jgi:hypothetical protein
MAMVLFHNITSGEVDIYALQALVRHRSFESTYEKFGWIREDSDDRIFTVSGAKIQQ